MTEHQPYNKSYKLEIEGMIKNNIIFIWITAAI